ncbi:MAG: SPASM domain-containing protein [Nitrospirae bacterium]|nr:SPASM domain-containing protein [Nitrospirota bacterium]
MPDYGHPAGIQFYPNLSCNYSCDFCFNRGISATGLISHGDFSSLINILIKLGIKGIDILGGEPTLHPNISEFAVLINENNLTCTISTNGSNVSVLRHISNAATRPNVKIGVSVNDKITPELDAFILEYKPYVKSVASKSALADSALKYIGLPMINYYLIFRDSMSDDGLQSTMPFVEYFEQLNALRQVHNGVDGVYCGGFLPDLEVYPELERARCPAGTTKLAVLPNGDVYPCNLFFRYRQFRLGNILSDDFQLIWGNPVLKYFRSFNGNTCPNRQCKLFRQCRGGCPAVSYAITGRLAAPDPRCI